MQMFGLVETFYPWFLSAPASLGSCIPMRWKLLAEGLSLRMLGREASSSLRLEYSSSLAAKRLPLRARHVRHV